MTETRKIAAIMAADVVGFSRMASADEDGTLAGNQLLWVKQRLADLIKHVLVEFVRADVALWAQSFLRSGAQHVVVAASVVTG